MIDLRWSGIRLDIWWFNTCRILRRFIVELIAALDDAKPKNKKGRAESFLSSSFPALATSPRSQEGTCRSHFPGLAEDQVSYRWSSFVAQSAMCQVASTFKVFNVRFRTKCRRIILMLRHDKALTKRKMLLDYCRPTTPYYHEGDHVQRDSR